VSSDALQDWTDQIRDGQNKFCDDDPLLVKRRSGAAERFGESGFPGRKHEEWRYTPLSSMVDGRCSSPLARVEELKGVGDLPVASIARIVLLNGEFRSDLSDLSRLPGSLKIGSLATLRAEEPRKLNDQLDSFFPPEDHPFQDLADAHLDDGVILEVVDEDVTVEGSVHIIHAFDGSEAAGSAHLTGLIHVASGSKLHLVEEVRCQGDVLGNIRWGVCTGARSDVRRLRVIRRGGTSIFHRTVVQQQTDSRFEDVFCCSGTRLMRNEIAASHEGSGCHTELLGAYVARGNEHVDNHTTIDHRIEDCTSREVYRGVLAEKSKGIFTGMIHVHQDAQRTDAKQSNDSILLSGEAEANTRPRLEIYADDVKCTHGATIGELDEDALFYLRSRGISASEARSILVRAFTSEVLEGLADEAIREMISEELQEAIPSGAGES